MNWYSFLGPPWQNPPFVQFRLQMINFPKLQVAFRRTSVEKKIITIRSSGNTTYGDGSKPWYLVNPKIAGKWMFIPLKMVLIGIDPYPYTCEK